jgi:hypothetical protein
VSVEPSRLGVDTRWGMYHDLLRPDPPIRGGALAPRTRHLAARLLRSSFTAATGCAQSGARRRTTIWRTWTPISLAWIRWIRAYAQCQLKSARCRILDCDACRSVGQLPATYRIGIASPPDGFVSSRRAIRRGRYRQAQSKGRGCRRGRPHCPGSSKPPRSVGSGEAQLPCIGPTRRPEARDNVWPVAVWSLPRTRAWAPCRATARLGDCCWRSAPAFAPVCAPATISRRCRSVPSISLAPAHRW